MCFFKKKKKNVVHIESKYKLGESIRFKYKGELCPGYINRIYLNNEQNVMYDVQIGGECPAIISNVKEEEIIQIKR